MAPFFFRNLQLKTFVSLVLFSLPVFLVLMLKPKIMGDAREYILTQESLRNHWSPEFRRADMDSMLLNVSPEDSDSLEKWFRELLIPGIEKNKLDVGGYVPGRDGIYRSYHFFAYSLCSLPFRGLCDLLGLHSLYSFTLLHGFLLCLATLFIFRSHYFTLFEKWWLVASLLYFCSIFYFDWIHPEVMTTALLVIAVLFFLERKTATALLFASLAALQNQSIALVLPIFYLYTGIENLQKGHSFFRLIFPFFRLHQWLLVIASAFIVLLPSIYYVGVYGHANPIASLGGLSLKWLSFSRFFSLWFDLNQGIILGFPGIMIGLLAVLIVTMLCYRCSFADRSTRDAVLLIVLAITISIPCLIQGNWNAGCAFMVRYGLWIGIPLVFSFVILLRNTGRRTRMNLIVLGLSFQIAVPFLSGFPAKCNNLEFNPISSWMLKYAPGFFNPEPEIFAERICKKEGVMNFKNVFDWENEGEVCKLLIRKDQVKYSIIFGEMNVYRPLGPVKTVEKSHGWIYLNGQFSKTAVSVFTIPYDDEAVEWENWSYLEAGFRWSAGTESAIIFELPDEGFDTLGLLRIDLQPQGQKKDIMIHLNGRTLFNGILVERTRLVLEFCPEWILSGEKNILIINVTNPQKSAKNPDTRMLGVRFFGLEFQNSPHE